MMMLNGFYYTIFGLMIIPTLKQMFEFTNMDNFGLTKFAPGPDGGPNLVLYDSSTDMLVIRFVKNEPFTKRVIYHSIPLPANIMKVNKTIVTDYYINGHVLNPRGFRASEEYRAWFDGLTVDEQIIMKLYPPDHQDKIKEIIKKVESDLRTLG